MELRGTLNYEFLMPNLGNKTKLLYRFLTIETFEHNLINLVQKKSLLDYV